VRRPFRGLKMSLNPSDDRHKPSLDHIVAGDDHGYGILNSNGGEDIAQVRGLSLQWEKATVTAVLLRLRSQWLCPLGQSKPFIEQCVEVYRGVQITCFTLIIDI
jgi:hypothetical protein